MNKKKEVLDLLKNKDYKVSLHANGYLADNRDRGKWRGFCFAKYNNQDACMWCNSKRYCDNKKVYSSQYIIDNKSGDIFAYINDVDRDIYDSLLSISESGKDLSSYLPDGTVIDFFYWTEKVDKLRSGRKYMKKNIGGFVKKKGYWGYTATDLSGKKVKPNINKLISTISKSSTEKIKVREFSSFRCDVWKMKKKAGISIKINVMSDVSLYIFK